MTFVFLFLFFLICGMAKTWLKMGVLFGWKLVNWLFCVFLIQKKPWFVERLLWSLVPSATGHPLFVPLGAKTRRYPSCTAKKWPSGRRWSPELHEKCVVKFWKKPYWIILNHMWLSIITRWWFHFFFDFHPYLGKWSNLTHSFQMGWTHQLDYRALPTPKKQRQLTIFGGDPNFGWADKFSAISPGKGADWRVGAKWSQRCKDGWHGYVWLVCLDTEKDVWFCAVCLLLVSSALDLYKGSLSLDSWNDDLGWCVLAASLHWRSVFLNKMTCWLIGSRDYEPENFTAILSTGSTKIIL